MEIELIFNRKDFEEIYFNANQGSYLHNERIKKPFQNMLISGLIFFLFVFNWISDGGIQVGTILIGIVFFYFLVNYTLKAHRIWKRRKKVADYLNEVETIRSHKIILTEEKFEIQQENKITSEFWIDFEKPEINDMFAHLVSKTENYLIPKKSMTELEYQKLTSILREKI